MTKDATPERSSRILNKVWENEKYFNKKDEAHVVGMQKRFASLEMSGRKEPFHDHRLNMSIGTTMNTFHQTMTQPRSTGFIDFDKQTKRAPFPVHKAHEHRF